MPNKQKIEERFMTIQARMDGEKKVYTASLSSEIIVERYGYSEVLRHDKDSINMERAENGLVLLFNHNIDKPLGRVSNIGLRGDGKLSGELVFSDSATGREYQGLVDEEILTDISIRYSVDETTETENRDTGKIQVDVTRWTPLEASLVTVPADHTVGIGRNHQQPEGATMPKVTDDKTLADGDKNTVIDFTSARKAGQSEGRQIEFERQRGINELFDAPRYQGQTYGALRTALIAGGSSVEQSRSELLKLVGNEIDGDNYTPPTPPQHDQRQAPNSSRVTIKNDGIDVQAEGMRLAIAEKFGQLDKGDDEKLKGNDYRGWGMAELARESLNIMGIDTRGFSPRDTVGYALNPMALPYGAQRAFVGAGTSVFTSLVESIIGKTMIAGFEESNETWRSICSIGSVSSFRQESRVDISSFSDLDAIAENGEYKHGKMSDVNEYIQAVKYGKMFSITREMIINDDLSAMMQVPTAMGRSADRKLGDLAYAVLTSNPTLNQDATALFHADHSNIISSGAAPRISELDKMYQLMALQSDIDNNASGQNIQMALLIVPVALEMTARVLASATNDPDQKTAESGGGGTRPNPFAGRFEVVSDPRLDADSSLKYYGMGAPSLTPGIEMAFINGQQAPALESQNGFTVDGISYKVRMEAGVAPLSYRAMVRNAGE